MAACATYAHSSTRSLPNSTLAQRPSWGGWSAAEVFEHLCVTDGLYEAPLRALFAAERARSAQRLLLAIPPLQSIDVDREPIALVRALVADATFQLK